MGDIVIIGGCGHVGLPLGLAFTRAGRNVVCQDLDAAKVDQTNSGVMPFLDAGADEALTEALQSGRFRCTTDPSVVSEAKVVITVIGTPLDEHLNPRLEVYHNLIEEEAPLLRDGQLLIMRSTVYPGTTQRVAEVLARDGLEIDVAYCPERVAEGKGLEEIHSLPQIVAGCSDQAQQRAEELFKLLTPDIVPTKPVTAELTKLCTNAWRYIQFSIANQFYMIANDHGVDFTELHAAMTHEYPRAKHFPMAGFTAGPCLLKDTMQLAAFHNNAFFLGHAAMLVNEGLPNYLVRAAAGRFDLAGSVVGILGMTFKGDSDDPRDSLSFKLKKTLLAECKEVLCSDPYMKDPAFTSMEDTIERSDLLFIGAPHRDYRDLDVTKPLIDIWNVTRSGISML
jgi:UDP-N-acetyl-D-mannosaminuronic acid dehydrogenase